LPFYEGLICHCSVLPALFMAKSLLLGYIDTEANGKVSYRVLIEIKPMKEKSI
jgi:hypothetical protein